MPGSSTLPRLAENGEPMDAEFEASLVLNASVFGILRVVKQRACSSEDTEYHITWQSKQAVEVFLED